MSGRAGALLAGAAVAAAILAWVMTSGSEALPEQPAPSAAPAPTGRVPAPDIARFAGAPPRPPRMLPPGSLDPVVMQPPAPPGSSAAAPPPTTEGSVPLDRAPQLPLDAGPRFPMSAQGIKAAIAEAKPELQHCYEEWSKVSPSLQGTLAIGFRISDDGVVTRVRLVEDAGMGNAAFEGCVLSVMGDLRFDATEAGGDLEVTYPLIFSNDGGGSSFRK